MNSSPGLITLVVGQGGIFTFMLDTASSRVGIDMKPSPGLITLVVGQGGAFTFMLDTAPSGVASVFLFWFVVLEQPFPF